MMHRRQPVFEAILGRDWACLPSVFLKHYANRAFSTDIVVAEGLMVVELSWLMRCLAPLLRMSGALVTIEGRDVPVTVTFRSNPKDNSFCLDREFRFQKQGTYRFRSLMIPLEANKVIEWMPAGIGWRTAFSWTGGRVRLAHSGFVLRLFGRVLPLPIEFLIGRGDAWEEAIDDHSFRMEMTLRHRLLGTLYCYRGTFEITETRLGP